MLVMLMIRPPPRALHVWNGEAREPDRGEQLEIEVGLPGGIAHRLEFTGRGCACVVDQDIEAAQACDDLVHRAHAVLGAADVGLYRQRLGANRTQRRGRAFESFGTACDDRHPRPLGRKPQRACATDSLRPARDERNLSLQPEIHTFSSLKGILRSRVVK